MSTVPTAWNVVVLGAWNPAILTPDGIRKRLFELPEGTPVKVEVSINNPGPHRVRHDGLLVTAKYDLLDVVADPCDLPTLADASNVARRALTDIPETPVSAAGINFRFGIDEIPDPLLELVVTPLDNSLSDNGFEIKERRLARSLAM